MVSPENPLTLWAPSILINSPSPVVSTMGTDLFDSKFTYVRLDLDIPGQDASYPSNTTAGSTSTPRPPIETQQIQRTLSTPV